MLKPIEEVAESFGLAREDWLPFGRDKAKVCVAPDGKTKPGKLVLVSGITPTKAGEGKTTTTVSLGMGLNRRGKRTTVALREPSLGPVFGIKGGGTGGGVAQIQPADDINLHFTGDIHAVGSAHNLLAALVDNELHFGTSGTERSRLDHRRVSWGRVLDMNDRALRNVVVGLGERASGVPRQTHFDITAASEVMAVLCLASDEEDLKRRLGKIVVGEDRDRKLVTASDLAAESSMTALLRHALYPNLVQTTEGTPALVHGGPFANIAHGCSSVIATRIAREHSEIVLTEAGFGFDLGGEKFLHIKCREAGFWPDAAVIVSTVRALKAHDPKGKSMEQGLRNLDKHLENASKFGLPCVVAVNIFDGDDPDEVRTVVDHCEGRGVKAASCSGFVDGGAGAEALADQVIATLDEGQKTEPKYLYDLDATYQQKMDALTREIYGGEAVVIAPNARRKLKRWEDSGIRLPVCMAKTPLSLSDDPRLAGRPEGFEVHVRDVRLSHGAGFVVALAGDVMTMPGLPRDPAARHVRIDGDGRVHGLMR